MIVLQNVMIAQTVKVTLKDAIITLVQRAAASHHSVTSQLAAAKPSFGDKPARSGKPAFGDKPARGGKPSFGSKPAFNKRPNFGDKPAAQKPSSDRGDGGAKRASPAPKKRVGAARPGRNATPQGGQGTLKRRR